MNDTLSVVPYDETDELFVDGLALIRTQVDPARLGHRHAHGFHQVSLLLSNPGRFEWHAGQSVTHSGRVAAGDVAVWPAHLPGFVRCERPFEVVTLRISTPLLGQVASSMDVSTHGFRAATLRRDHFLAETIRKLAEDSGATKVGDELFARSLGTSLAIHLLREYAGERSRPKGLFQCRREADFRQVRAYIEGHLDGDLSIKALAAVACLSPYHFLRKFQAATGSTPHQYVIKCRVNRARELLLSGGDIAQTALNVGFANQAHLSHHIRRAFGVTPSELALHREFDDDPR